MALEFIARYLYSLFVRFGRSTSTADLWLLALIMAVGAGWPLAMALSLWIGASVNAISAYCNSSCAPYQHAADVAAVVGFMVFGAPVESFGTMSAYLRATVTAPELGSIAAYGRSPSFNRLAALLGAGMGTVSLGTDRCTQVTISIFSSLCDASQALMRPSRCDQLSRCAWLRGTARGGAFAVVPLLLAHRAGRPC